MIERLPIQVTEPAAAQIREAHRWWRENRSASPNALKEELARGFQSITEIPEAGAHALDIDIPDVRRICLRRVRYYLYYRVLESPRCVEVVALWHTSRGTPPEL